MSPVLVVTRLVVPEQESAAFLARAQAELAAFAARPGYVRGRIGRAADDASAWVLTTEWVGVGAYRRSLSAYDVKVDAAPLLSLGVDEPSAYELLHRDDASSAPVVEVSRRAADADRIGVGEASGPPAVDQRLIADEG